MGTDNKPEVYFHVGLGKTASTWLQNKVFGHFEGITYLHPTQYRHWKETIAGSQQPKVLISREMDQQLEREVKKFAAVRPDTTPIILLRSNAQWIASQYRRFLKNGYPLTFTEFFDVTHDAGYWKRSDVLLYPKIAILKQYFTLPPIVCLYEDLRRNPQQFVTDLAAQMGVNCQVEHISVDKHHASYNEKQLKWMLIVAKRIFKIPVYNPNGPRWKTWIRRRPRMWLCYVILYSAHLIPASWLSKKPLIDPEILKKIDAYYHDDWQACLQTMRRP